MVGMHKLTLHVSDKTFEWIERSRGERSAEEYAADAIEERMAEADAWRNSSLLHEHLIKRLDDLEERLERLNATLRQEEVRLHSR